MKNVRINKVTHSPKGALSFPGDKSLSHRAIIFGSLAEGESHFTNVLPAEDCVCTLEAFRAMGVEIRQKSPTELTIVGQGLRSLRVPKRELWMGNSGTAMRLLLGVLAGQDFEATLTGDPSLSSRPMRRVTDYLKQMGAVIEGKDGANFAPLQVHGGKLKAIDAKLPIASAQVKSALLLAGLYAEGETQITEPEKSRDHTERFLHYFGAEGIKERGLTVSITAPKKLEGRSFEIAGDVSSAAFFMGLAALVAGAEISFRSVLWNPTRTGIVDILKGMGVQIERLKVSEKGPELTADFIIRHTKDLKPFNISKTELPRLIDEVPILTLLATQAQGVSVIHDADELRVKETDRIHSMVTGLSSLGAKVKSEGNTIIIEGPTPLKGATLDSFKDHRTAMSFLVAGMIAKEPVTVKDLDCINTSFPNFFELLKTLGIGVQPC